MCVPGVFSSSGDIKYIRTVLEGVKQTDGYLEYIGEYSAGSAHQRDSTIHVGNNI